MAYFRKNMEISIHGGAGSVTCIYLINCRCTRTYEIFYIFHDSAADQSVSSGVPDTG